MDLDGITMEPTIYIYTVDGITMDHKWSQNVSLGWWIRTWDDTGSVWCRRPLPSMLWARFSRGRARGCESEPNSSASYCFKDRSVRYWDRWRKIAWSGGPFNFCWRGCTFWMRWRKDLKQMCHKKSLMRSSLVLLQTFWCLEVSGSGTIVCQRLAGPCAPMYWRRIRIGIRLLTLTRTSGMIGVGDRGSRQIKCMSTLLLDGHSLNWPNAWLGQFLSSAPICAVRVTCVTMTMALPFHDELPEQARVWQQLELVIESLGCEVFLISETWN